MARCPCPFCQPRVRRRVRLAAMEQSLWSEEGSAEILPVDIIEAAAAATARGPRNLATSCKTGTIVCCSAVLRIVTIYAGESVSVLRSLLIGSSRTAVTTTKGAALFVRGTVSRIKSSGESARALCLLLQTSHRITKSLQTTAATTLLLCT